MRCYKENQFEPTDMGLTCHRSGVDIKVFPNRHTSDVFMTVSTASAKGQLKWLKLVGFHSKVFRHSPQRRQRSLERPGCAAAKLWKGRH